MDKCQGVGKPPTEIRVKPANVQGFKYGRGKCSGCPKTIALTKNGVVVNHQSRII